MLEGYSDEELVRVCQQCAPGPNRNAHAEELFRRHVRRVGLWCLRMVGDRESAADVAQEVFVKVFQKLDSFRGDAQFSTWLYTVTRRHCYDFVRSRSNDATTGAADGEWDNVADANAVDPLAALEGAQSRAAAHAILRESLDEVERQVFILHFGEGLTLAAITRLLRLKNTSGAKAYIVSAKRKIRRATERWRASGRLASRGAGPSVRDG